MTGVPIGPTLTVRPVSALNAGDFCAPSVLVLFTEFIEDLSGVFAPAIFLVPPSRPATSPLLAPEDDGRFDPTPPLVPLSRPPTSPRPLEGEVLEGPPEPEPPIIPPPGPPLEGLDPAPADLLVDAGLFAEPPLIAPAGGNEGSPLGPLS